MAVTPEENSRLNPEYVRQEDAWMRLLAHEIAHRLHIAVLEGDEEAMGPTWFFEGFAVFASGQQLGDPVTYKTADEALTGVHSGEPLAYRRFGAALKYFADRIALSDLIRQAGKGDFEDWLREQSRK